MQELSVLLNEKMKALNRKPCKKHPYSKVDLDCTSNGGAALYCAYCDTIIAFLPPNKCLHLTAYGRGAQSQIAWQDYPIKDDRGKHGVR